MREWQLPGVWVASFAFTTMAQHCNPLLTELLEMSFSIETITSMSCT